MWQMYLEFAGDLLEAGRSDPGRRMVRVGLAHRLEQQARLLMSLMSPPYVGIIDCRSVR